ncbi:hypothetical protein AAGQ96_03210 [Pantoea sp. MBD-2R]|uniref:hypothetical protein n=1 Tax=unclassified Pantoea TaxID=2630326 RepID=UPI0011BF4D66|nr:hypothetical protein [Pantoea sp. CCBC3-3-1]
MDEYIYHIAKKRIAFDNIKQQGLVPAARLSGASVAQREGAFATDRAKNSEKKEILKLRGALYLGATRGYTLEEIKNKNYMFTAIPVDLNSDREEAMKTLTDFETNFYNEYFPKRAVKGPRARPQDFEEPAAKMLRDNPNHALCRFAKDYVRLHYAIEERVTSNHIYFFETKYSSDCYRDYTKHHQGEINCRVLRVRRTVINHLEQDMSEFRGKMTRESVNPEFIEVYNAEGSPFSSAAGEHWTPLTEARES